MSMNSFGHLFSITTFGESHGEAVGVVIDGVPPGIAITEEEVQLELNRRRPGQSNVTTPRDEKDKIKFYSGMFEGKTTGTPLMMMVVNENVRSRDYSKIMDKYRPMHADYTYDMRYGFRDYRGGGRSSARETLARVAAGAVAQKALEQVAGIRIIGHVKSVGPVAAESFDESAIEKNSVRAADLEAAKRMEEYILLMKEQLDSAGGIVQVIAKNVPPGLGSPTYWKIKAELAAALMGINAVQGVEYGSGFEGTKVRGSEHNDPFYFDEEENRVRTRTNNHGGILGGITSGEDLVLNVAFKPVSSLPRAQESVTKENEGTEIKTFGRHEKCVVPRAVPICEAMVAITLLDHWLIGQAYRAHVQQAYEATHSAPLPTALQNPVVPPAVVPEKEDAAAAAVAAAPAE